MEHQERRHRVFTFEIPATDGSMWSFEFHCRWVWVAPLQVVFVWREDTISSGEASWQDSGISWGSLFKGWLIVREVALDKAIEYEIGDRARVSR